MIFDKKSVLSENINTYDEYSVDVNTQKVDENCEYKLKPLYLLQLESKQRINKLLEKDVSEFVSSLVLDIDKANQSIVYTLLKQVILNGYYKKSDIINEFLNMYDEDKLNAVDNKSSAFLLRNFVDLNVEQRKEMLTNWVTLIEKKISDFKETEKYKMYIPKFLYNDINNMSFSHCINYNNNEIKNLYIYDNGHVLGIHYRNGIYRSVYDAMSDNTLQFIKELIKKYSFSEDKNVYFKMDNQKYNIDEELFDIIQLLIEVDDVSVPSLLNIAENKQNEHLKNRCLSIIEDLELSDVDMYRLGLLYKGIDTNKSIMYFEKCNIALSNYELYWLYRNNGNDSSSKEAMEKLDYIYDKYYELTKKDCYKIVIDTETKPGLTDSKMYSPAYLENIEDYPLTKDNRPMIMLIQINLSDVVLEGMPNKGLLQVFVDPKSFYDHDTFYKTKYCVKYYKEIKKSVNYDKSIETPSEYLFSEEENVKIKFEKYTDIGYGGSEVIKQIISSFDSTLGYDKLKSINIDIKDIISDIIYYFEMNRFKKAPMTFGGYPTFQQDCSDDYKKYPICILKLMHSDDGSDPDAPTIDLLIKESDLKNNNLESSVLIATD